jgi:hypothetical protein
MPEPGRMSDDPDDPHAGEADRDVTPLEGWLKRLRRA